MWVRKQIQTSTDKKVGRSSCENLRGITPVGIASRHRVGMALRQLPSTRKKCDRWESDKLSTRSDCTDQISI